VWPVKSAALYSTTRKRSVQAHARFKYHGKPAVFSDVAVAQPEGEWYARLRLLFKCNYRGTEHDLAFVLWFEDAPEASPEPYQRSTYLCWEIGPGRPGPRGGRGQPEFKYGVVGLSSILRLVYTHRDHVITSNDERAARFFVNRYIRCEPA
jgi:hypothetical protein